MKRFFIPLFLSMFLTPVYGLELKPQISLNIGSYSISDPDGETNPRTLASISAGTAFALSARYGLGLWSDYGFVFGQFRATGNDYVSQKYSSFYTNQILQKNIASIGGFNLFAGAGVGFGLNDYTNRLLSDGDGYIKARLDDRSTVAVNGILQSGLLAPTSSLNFGRYRLKLKPGVIVQYSVPMTDDVSSFEIKALAIISN